MASVNIYICVVWMQVRFHVLNYYNALSTMYQDVFTETIFKS